MKRPGMYCVIFFFCCFAPVFAEAGILVPREVFVADEAELGFETAAFSGLADPGVVLTVLPADLPVSVDSTIKSIEVQIGSTAAQVTVRFVPWKSGIVQLPSFTLLGVRVIPPPVRIASLADKTGRTVLESARSPLLVPGTTYLLYGLIAVFLAVLSLAIAGAVHIRKYLSLFLEKNQAGRRVVLIHKQLRMLEKQARKTGAAEWYCTFAAVLRMYLASLCTGKSGGFSASTASEIVSVFGDILGSSSGLTVTRLCSLLKRTDLVRFSGYPVLETRREDSAETRELVTLLEEEMTSAEAVTAATDSDAAASALEVSNVQL